MSRIDYLLNLYVFSSAKEYHLLSDTTMWSSSAMSNTLAASLSLSVAAMSFEPGIGFPEGWLWNMMMAVAFFISAVRMI